MTATIEDVANQRFDYIVVGGGTAGLVVAARLSEDPNVSVLVLEAGQANLNDPVLLHPDSHGNHFGNDQYSWNYVTTEQEFSAGVRWSWHRGKGLGGSSGINFLQWTKPPAEEVNEIEKLGNPGWNWDTIQRQFRKIEGFIPPTKDVQEQFHLNFDDYGVGTEGPLNVAFPGTINPVNLILRETYLNAGVPLARKPYNGDPKGYYLVLQTYDPRTRTRTYSPTAYYLPHKDRTNLTVLTSALVSRILTKKMSDGQLSSRGVEFLHGDKTYSAATRKEVILTAGTLQSAHLLELSGIGNKEVLRKINVPLLKELPGVGQNVQEHAVLVTSWELKENVDLENLNILNKPIISSQEFYAKETGVYTGGRSVVFTSLQNISPKAADIIEKAQKAITKKMETASPSLREQYNIQLDRLERGAPAAEFIASVMFVPGPNPPASGKQQIRLVCAANHFFSRGTIHSVSNDPKVDPEFDPHYFEEEVDLDMLVEQVKWARHLAEHVSPLKDIIVKAVNPGPEVQTDDEIRESIKKAGMTTWHTVGSCSMLPEDKEGVVDPSLKVYGTTNIRVADLSIIPLNFAAHSQAMVYAIAERAAEIIKTQS
ncbi:GMC oxidoreductase [Panus rudis PR-1116 ss-1]|nr:GMC oxidoreductase [Panus rudis PR-1116 ss-1]